MVQDLNDPEALSAAEALQSKAYLIYIDYELELPFPNKPWYRYDVSAIAPSLRAEDADEGYAADMCVPIFPNTSHRLGRTPVRTEPVFPYSNCYHWAEFKMELRVRARPEQFDEREATLLPDAECEKLEGYLGEDILRLGQLRRQYRAATGWQAPAAQPGMPDYGKSFDHRPTSASASTSSVDSSSDYADSTLSDESENSVEAIMDIFSGPNGDMGVIPLVDLWLDLAGNLKQEDIASPPEFLKERDAVVSIIQAARARAYAALNAPPPGAAPQPETVPAQQREADVRGLKTKGSTRSLLRMSKLLRKWSLGIKALTNRDIGIRKRTANPDSSLGAPSTPASSTAGTAQNEFDLAVDVGEHPRHVVPYRRTKDQPGTGSSDLTLVRATETALLDLFYPILRI
ncbi:hypothetical protein VTO73DRAFT_12770 [Trametes versicolor]